MREWLGQATPTVAIPTLVARATTSDGGNPGGVKRPNGLACSFLLKTYIEISLSGQTLTLAANRGLFGDRKRSRSADLKHKVAVTAVILHITISHLHPGAKRCLARFPESNWVTTRCR